jgi:hypothetical protein
VTLTEHLRRYLDKGEPDVPLLAALANEVRERLRAARMWQQPPEYFGYPEYHSWQEAFSGDDAAPGPVADFFLEKIVPEQSFLTQTLGAGNDVEALVRQKVKWFLIDRQKRHDPVGYRAFMNLVAVVEAMAAGGAAVVENRVRGKVRNPTLVRLTRGGPGPPAGADELARVIDADAEWQPVLRRLAKLGTGAQRLLRERLERLPSAGVVAFVVGELGDLLKARARAANEAWNRPEDLDRADESRTGPPGGRYPTSEEDLTALGRGLRQAVEKSDCTPKVKRGLVAVFEDWEKYLAAGQDHPQVREWASQLGLARSTLADYLRRLRGLLQAVLDRRSAD